MAGNNHGHTPAAWTGVIIAFIGFCVSAAFTVMAEPVGFWVGLGIVAVGGIVGLAMRMAGMGQQPRRSAAQQARTPQGA
ncbi:hypothetical protein IHE55_05880 [Streptomyces pactum]|uniref:Uncharacterized protein n=1 Tax=Streptomyces pactum TaxID=68249 RepID=A0ABS0NGN4_9ACTN|nr:HGxxPAAW family protein [Streptomyces pactum]MBH5334355.1 hypothetical protein [Streptomyces pactum]